MHVVINNVCTNLILFILLLKVLSRLLSFSESLISALNVTQSLSLLQVYSGLIVTVLVLEDTPAEGGHISTVDVFFRMEW